MQQSDDAKIQQQSDEAKMQKGDDAKVAEFLGFFKDFDIQDAFLKQSEECWADFCRPPYSRPDDNDNSDEEPVVEEWMKPIYDMMKEEARKNASKAMNAEKKSEN